MNKTRINITLDFLLILFLLLLGVCSGCGKAGENAVKKEQLNQGFHTITQVSNSDSITSIHNNLREKESKNANRDKIALRDTLHSQKDSTLQKPYQYPIQKDTSKYHQYGELRLKRNTSTGGGYEAKIGQYYYREGYPGIINKGNPLEGGTTEIHYYNPTTKELIKTIDIKSLNPYISKYEKIQWRYPSFEYYQAPPENEKHLYENAQPEEYLTFSGGGAGRMNGYAQLRYTVVGIKNQKILTWESTLIILDQTGETHTSITEPNQIGTSYMSRNGEIIAYNFGGYPDNPYAVQEGVKILNLTKNEVIYPDLSKDQPPMRLGCDFKYGNLVRISKPDTYLLDSTKMTSVEFIDLDSRLHYFTKLPLDDYQDALRRVDCNSCLINYLHFEIKKI